jgi:hypothetical protein
MLAGMGRVPAVALLLARILAGIWEWMGLPTMAWQLAPLEWVRTQEGTWGSSLARGGSWGWASLPCVGGFPRVETLLGWMGWGPWARGCSVRCLTLLVLGWGWLSYLVVPATF